MIMRVSNSWLRRRIDASNENVEVEAGLPMHKCTSLSGISAEREQNRSEPSRVLLGRLLHQLRRRDKMALSKLSSEVRVPEEELAALESGVEVAAKPRTLHQLATYYRISPKALIALSPAIANRDPDLDKAAFKFAASSNDLSKLSREEKRSLNEFVELLSTYKEGR